MASELPPHYNRDSILWFALLVALMAGTVTALWFAFPLPAVCGGVAAAFVYGYSHRRLRQMISDFEAPCSR